MRNRASQQKLREITELILQGHDLTYIARLRGVSRQAIHSFVSRQGINYHNILEARWDEREYRKKIARIRKCRVCGHLYSTDEVGARTYFCSYKCWHENNKRWQREAKRKFYKTDKWKAYHDAYVEKNREKLNAYAREYAKRHRKENNLKAKIYRHKNKDRINAYYRERYRLKRLKQSK